MSQTLRSIIATITTAAAIVYVPFVASAQELALSPVLTEDEINKIAEEVPHHPEEVNVEPENADLDPNESGMNNNNIDNHTFKDWTRTENPQSEITPGNMRSDREPLPEGITKEDADKAETMEAEEKAQNQGLRQERGEKQDCEVFWPSPFKVCGELREKYNSLGGPISFLGLPKSDELINEDGTGKRIEFTNGFIYWHPDAGAWSISTYNASVWLRNGGEKGELGYPTSDEIRLEDGKGRKQTFQKGRIYASKRGIATISGDVLEKWVEVGEEKSRLGLPVTNRVRLPDGKGSFVRFTCGFIVSHPDHGTHPVEGEILNQWAKSGFEKGDFGYPVGDAAAGTDPLVLQQKFEKGELNGYIETVLNIARFMPGPEGHKIEAKQIYEDGMKYIEKQGGDPLEIFQSALTEVLEYSRSRNNMGNEDKPVFDGVQESGGLPGGSSTDPHDPQNRGDLFFGDSVTAKYNHGHVGIFVAQPGKKDHRRNDTVEAQGYPRHSISGGEREGVNLVENWAPGEERRKGDPRIRNLRQMKVEFMPDGDKKSEQERNKYFSEIRNKAADFANDKAGVDADGNIVKDNAAYNYNFAFNRSDPVDKYNCSQLVWAAYGNATTGKLDLDANGGVGVWPEDILNSPHTIKYEVTLEEEK